MTTDSRFNPKSVAVLAACVYFIQGALGISAIAAPVFFRRMGWSISEIAVFTSFAALPWILKILYGLVSDAVPLFGLRRKPYLFFYLACSAAGWCALAFAPGEKNTLLLALLIANLGFAGTDVITDGLVVEHSEGDWARIYQGISWGFRSVGSVMTGMLGGWLVTRFAPQTIFLITAALPFLALPAIAMLREAPYGERFSATEFADKVKTAGRMLIKPSALFFGLFFSASVSASLFGMPFFFHMKEKLGFDESYLGFLISLGWAGAALGSLIYGAWLKHVPMKTLLRMVVIVNTVNILTTYAVTGTVSAAILIFLGGIATGIALPPLMSGAAVMTAGSGVEGTLFAIWMGWFNLSQLGWGMIGGNLLPLLGISGLIAIAALIQASAYFFVPKILPEIKGT